MVLHGINSPLSTLGTEYIWKQTFINDFGLNRSDLDDFFSGPAFLPWHWMGNLDEWQGPLSDDWMERGRNLQHNFLARAREFGMTPVFPAFNGFVPKALAAKFPNSKVTKSSGWCDFEPTYAVDPLDPLFLEIGRKFVKNLCDEYGCPEARPMFNADLYNELGNLLALSTLITLAILITLITLVCLITI